MFAGLCVHRIWVHIAVCELVALNVGSLAAIVGSRPLIFAVIVGSKSPLFAGLSAAVCEPLHLTIDSQAFCPDNTILVAFSAVLPHVHYQ
jgi:hypothetical protein